MLRMLTLSNFSIAFQDFENNKDYNMRISFKPETKDEEKLGQIFGFVLYPFSFGIVDTTISSETYDCTIFYDDEDFRIITNPKPTFAFFTKKLNKHPESISPSEPGKISQSMDSRTGTKFRGIKGPIDGVSINLGENCIELVVGDTKVILGKQGISFYGSITEYSLPEKSQGGLLKETGILRLLPKCFVPPFCMPDYVPDLTLIQKTNGMLNVVKKLKDALG